jgi:hypothetical protein
MANYYSFSSPKEPTMPVQDGKGVFTFNVTNISERGLATRYEISSSPPPPDGQEQPAWTKWLKVDRPQRMVPASGLEQVAVRLEAPAGAEGKYSFFLRSISTQRPDEDFTDGPVIGFSVTKPVTPPPPTPWKWIILAAAVLVVILGVVLYFVLRPKGIPDVTGKSVAEATQILAKKDLTVRSRRSQSSDKAAGTVIGENPPAGSPIPDDKQVDLIVAGPAAIVVPNVVGMPVGRALNALKAAGLGVGTTPPASSTVLSQNPRPGVSVAPGEKVDLFAQ